jgi:hypothetical protein
MKKVINQLKYKNFKLLFKYFKEDEIYNINKNKEVKICNIKTFNQPFEFKMYEECEFYTNFTIPSLVFFSNIYNKSEVSHQFNIIASQIFIPIFELNWHLQEEIKFVEGIEIYGFSNWENISKYIGTKSFIECEKHFSKIYFPYLSKFFSLHLRLFSNIKNQKVYNRKFNNMLKILDLKFQFKYKVQYKPKKSKYEENYFENMTKNSIPTIAFNKIQKPKKYKINGIFISLFNQILYKIFSNENFDDHYKTFDQKILIEKSNFNNIKDKNKKKLNFNNVINYLRLIKLYENQNSHYVSSLKFVKWLRFFIAKFNEKDIRDIEISKNYILRKAIQRKNKLKIICKVKQKKKKVYTTSLKNFLTRRENMIIFYLGLTPFGYIIYLTKIIVSKILNITFFKATHPFIFYFFLAIFA